MGQHPLLQGYSILRRGASRAAEYGLWGWVLETLGFIEGFVAYMSDPLSALGLGLIVVVISALFDLCEVVLQPKLPPSTCENDEPELPMEDK